MVALSSWQLSVGTAEWKLLLLGWLLSGCCDVLETSEVVLMVCFKCHATCLLICLLTTFIFFPPVPRIVYRTMKPDLGIKVQTQVGCVPESAFCRGVTCSVTVGVKAGTVSKQDPKQHIC